MAGSRTWSTPSAPSARCRSQCPAKKTKETNVAANSAVKAGSNAAERDFVISRVFDAPRDLVWKAFTEPARMKHWWGPKGFTVIASKMDLRPGGTYHYGMKAPDGSAMWGKFVFREVAAPARMVFINSFSDEAGGKTKLAIRWSPHNATTEEQKTFDASHDNMRQGWGGTLEQLTAYLAKNKS